MASEAVLVGCSSLVQDPPYGVRLMTVDAGRYHVRLLPPQAALNHLAVHLLDLRVALLAGLTNVVAVNAGCPIGVWQNLVRCVTGGADRSDSQALAEQAFTMYRTYIRLSYHVPYSWTHFPSPAEFHMSYDMPKVLTLVGSLTTC